MIKDNLGILKLDVEFEKGLAILDFSSFLYDFVLLHDFQVLCNIDEYREYTYKSSTWRGFYSGRFWLRKGRPIRDEDRLAVIAIDVHSPGSIVLGIGATVLSKTIVPLIESAEKIVDWKFNREKARFEAEKAKYEAFKAGYEADKALIERETAKVIHRRESILLTEEELEYIKTGTEIRILKRLQENPVKVIDLTIGQFGNNLDKEIVNNSVYEDDISLDRETQRIYEELKKIARNKRMTNYSDMGNLIGLDMATEYGRVRIAHILDDINKIEDQRSRPMLSSLVIHKDGNMPGPGYFECARGLGKFTGQDKLEFWANEVNEIHKYWSR